MSSKNWSKLFEKKAGKNRVFDKLVDDFFNLGSFESLEGKKNGLRVK